MSAVTYDGDDWSIQTVQDVLKGAPEAPEAKDGMLSLSWQCQTRHTACHFAVNAWLGSLLLCHALESTEVVQLTPALGTI
jgi:hypothetical protein